MFLKMGHNSASNSRSDTVVINPIAIWCERSCQLCKLPRRPKPNGLRSPSALQPFLHSRLNNRPVRQQNGGFLLGTAPTTRVRHCMEKTRTCHTRQISWCSERLCQMPYLGSYTSCSSTIHTGPSRCILGASHCLSQSDAESVQSPEIE